MELHVCSLLGVLALTTAISAAYAGWQVWTTTETKRVLREEPAGMGLAVRLSAARNEWEGFQILMRSDEPVRDVRVEVSDLKGPSGATIGIDHVRIYRQHQFHLTQGTYRNERFRPGWYPDPLIPLKHPLTRQPLSGGRFTAVPFDLPADETHGFWVDIYVPPDAPAGEYQGVYRVSGKGQGSVEMPVTLTVWDFTLPRTFTLQTALGSPADRMRGYYRERANAGKEKEPSDWEAVEAQCAALLSEHHINATPPRRLLTPRAQPDGTFRFSPEQVSALRDFVDRYHVNALQVPHPSSVVKDPEAERERLYAWLAAFDRLSEELNRPHILLYTYLKDEPNSLEDYRYVQRWGRIIREAKSAVKVLVVEQTWTAPGFPGADSAWGDLYGAVDIWCPLFSLFRPEPAAKRQALGEIIWAYTALCQGKPTPWWHIDYPLLNYRVPAWIAWRYRISGLLYWGGMSYWREVEDPWVEAPFYSGRGGLQTGRRGRIFWGEGSLVYPARAVGYDGIVPSLRLKALRDGIEDYEYMAILERSGLAAEAEKVVLPLAESWFKWETNPSAYETARARLAQLIVKAQRSR